MPEKNKNIHLTVQHRSLEKITKKEPVLEHKIMSIFAEKKVALEQVFFPFPISSVINFHVIHPTALQLESNQSLICQTHLL